MSIELTRCAEAVDKLKRQGERIDLASSDAQLSLGKSAAKTAAIVRTSQATVERVRTVLSDLEIREDGSQIPCHDRLRVARNTIYA